MNSSSNPVPDIANLDVITAGGSVDLTSYIPTATDECGTTIYGTTTQYVFDTQGTYTVTWTYDDGNGNFATQEQTVIVNSGVGLQSINNININVYPNPTNDLLNIVNARGFKAVVTDMSGRTIQTFEVKSNNTTINFSDKADGIYFIKFFDNNSISTIKFVKK